MFSLYRTCIFFVILLMFSACRTPSTPIPQELLQPAPIVPIVTPATSPIEPPQPEPEPPPPAAPVCPIPEPALITRTPDAILLLQPIIFDLNKATIRRESFPILDQIAGLLSCDLALSIVVEAHRDANPDMRYRAVEITKRRAQAVRDFLVSRGVDPARLQAVGFGEERPLVPNDSPENRAKNRRIELRIIKPVPISTP